MGSYFKSFNSDPRRVFTISQPSLKAPGLPPLAFFVAFGRELTLTSATMNTLFSGFLMYTYLNSGLTHKAKLLGSVQGVVVHATRDDCNSHPITGKPTITAGSETSR